MKKAFQIITNIVVIVALLLAFILVGVRLIGFQVFTVLSSSMEPNYQTGSLIYVKSVDYTELKIGDIITFMLNENQVATHRIVEIVPDENDPLVLQYRTKGDANNAVDGELVHYKNIIGTPIFTIPYLGYVANYIQQPPGIYITISLGIIMIVLVFLPELFEKNKGDKKKERVKETIKQHSKS